MEEYKPLFLAIQVVSSVIIIFSKYFLAREKGIGWWLSVTAYALIVAYNANKQLYVYAELTAALGLLSLYGGIKWRSKTAGLKGFDYAVITLTIMVAAFLAKTGHEAQLPLLVPQMFGVIVFMAAFLLLGFRKNLGWWFMFAGHFITGYIYIHIDAYAFVAVQAISAYIAITKFTKIPLLFFKETKKQQTI